MIVLMVFIIVVIFALLLIVGGFEPKQSTLSRFELERRRKNGEPAARAIAEREKMLVDVISIKHVLVALCLVLLTILSIAWFGIFIGTIITMVVVFSYGPIARLHPIRQQSQRVYRHSEHLLLALIRAHPTLFRLIRHPTMALDKEVHLESREELLHLITQSQRVLTPDEKSLMTHGLQFPSRKVSEVMRPRGKIDTIGAKELLGPLVLDDLHKTGHTRFPVVDKDIDHVIGVLHVRDLLSLDTKRSVTAEKAMEPRVFYIHQDQTLHHALMAFLRTYHHLFIVVNEDQETVGILSLEDTIEALIGRKIVDEFDAHSDIQRVARRNLRNTNRPTNREDV
ncbi:MAG TPA: CBS domain-containing protein [Candidatus Saccharimonadales bacterium]|jgi:CBS domain containing-hemolysin-like protein|nr:CBS domain-containing protein [Candidatus Saccharimonadales bacterium]